jgi:LacI family transcriptional regulator, galactose operon repressor
LLIDVFARQSVPVVVVGMDSPKPSLKTVDIDYEHGIRQAVQHLAGMGHVLENFGGSPRLTQRLIMKGYCQTSGD